jgi:hypothetical protein
VAQTAKLADFIGQYLKSAPKKPKQTYQAAKPKPKK